MSSTTTTTLSNSNKHITSSQPLASPETKDLAINDEGQKQGSECGRERLKKHRVDVAGRVLIPDIWGQEDLLKDWIDCSVFDRSLAPKGFMSARQALAQEQEGKQRSAATCCSPGL